MAQSNKPGGGGRFEKMVASGKSPALAAFIGREKFGKKKFQSFASKGKQQASALRTKGGKAEESAEGE